MTTRLEKTLRRELAIKGAAYVVALTPQGMKLTLKGHRKGVELTWEALISGDAALAVALNASVGLLEQTPRPGRDTVAATPEPPAARAPASSSREPVSPVREPSPTLKARPARKKRRGKQPPATSGSRRKAR